MQNFSDEFFYLRLKNNDLKKFQKPAVMGIINCSPNSFFRPISKLDEALKTVEKMVLSGVSIIDVGGEATNPMIDLKNQSLEIEQEKERVLPFIEAIKKRFDILISVDTSKPEVMQEAVNLGADMINDQRALKADNAIKTVSALKVPVCLMHSFNFSRTPGSADKFNLLNSIKKDLEESIQACLDHKITEDRIVIDPGFGQGNYGKNCEENFYLLAQLQEFMKLKYPVLVGWSRKSMIGDVLQKKPEDRLYGSLASASIAAYLGASILRVHDVSETIDAVKIIRQINQFKGC